LSDRNVISLLSDFSAHFPGSDINEIANKIIVVDYEKENSQMTETVRIRESVTDQNITYTSLKTDNYTQIFEQTAKINEGASPAEIRKYSSLIKRLILDAEDHGTLKETLVALYPLDGLESRIGSGQKVAIAIGDVENFQVVTLANYIQDYFSEHPKYKTEDALAFVASNSTTARTPFARIWNSLDKLPDSLNKYEVRRLNSMVKRNGDLSALKQNISKYYQRELPENFSLSNQNLSPKLARTANQIIWIIDSFSSAELNDFMVNRVVPLLIKNLRGDDSNHARTHYRKLLMAYDLVINGSMKPKNPAE
jgi:hypothetical protein